MVLGVKEGRRGTQATESPYGSGEMGYEEQNWMKGVDRKSGERWKRRGTLTGAPSGDEVGAAPCSLAQKHRAGGIPKHPAAGRTLCLKGSVGSAGLQCGCGTA